MDEKEIWAAYHRTTYCVRSDAGVPVYFRLIDPDLKTKVPPKSFAVITAWNPMNRPLSEKENAGRNRRLEELLKARGLKFYPTVGRTDDHCEESFTIEGITEAEALEIGRAFEQHAVVHSDGTGPRILKC